MRLDAFVDVLRRNAIIHDQDLFASPEVMVLRKQTHASSRRALLLELVRTGHLEWTPDVIDVIYSALNADVLDAHSVYARMESDLPSESAYIRAARADIVDAGLAPPSARELQDQFRNYGSPFAAVVVHVSPGEGDTVLFIDPATIALTPDAAGREQTLFGETCRGPVVAGYSAGYELFDLGFEADAHEAVTKALDAIHQTGASTVVTSSPEALVSLTRFAPALGIDHDLDVRYLYAWLPDEAIDKHQSGEPVAIADAFNLSRTLDESDAVRAFVSDRRGCEIRELTYSSHAAIPTGPMAGYPHPDAIPEMARRIWDDAGATGATRLVACSPWDYRNLSLGRRDGDPELIDLTRLIPMRSKHG